MPFIDDELFWYSDNDGKMDLTQCLQVSKQGNGAAFLHDLQRRKIDAKRIAVSTGTRLVRCVGTVRRDRLTARRESFSLSFFLK